MLMPKRMKHRKQHRGRMRGMATRGNTVAFGEYGLMAMECSWVSSRQIEAARIAMTRSIKRGGKVWIRIFPDKPITKKPLEQRMGKGKAAVEGYVAVIKPGRVMFEMDGVPEDQAREAMRLAAHKLPIDCRFVTKEEATREGLRPLIPGKRKIEATDSGEVGNGGSRQQDTVESTGDSNKAVAVDREEQNTENSVETVAPRQRPIDSGAASHDTPASEAPEEEGGSTSSEAADSKQDAGEEQAVKE